MRSNYVRIVATVFLATQFACYGPTRQYNPRTDFPERQPGHVIITFNDGRKTDISSPRVLGDSLAGWDIGAQKSVVYPLGTIKTVEGKERSAARSSLLGVAILSGIVVGSIIASRATSGEDNSSPF